MKVYARVENGKIVEYPVYEVHIRNRAHPFDWYVEVKFETLPVIPAFHFAKENVKLFNNTEVIVTYDIEPIGLSALLTQIQRDAGATGMPGESVVVNVASIDPALIARVITLAKEYVQEKMDKFAATREYDGVASVVSYKDSNRTSRAAEATHWIALRDNVWDTLYAYVADVMDGTKPVPKTVAEIDTQLPEFTWPE